VDIDRFQSEMDRQVERGNASRHTRRAYVGAMERFAAWLPGDEEPTVQDFKDFCFDAAAGDVTGTELAGASLNVAKCAFRKYLYTQGRSDEYDQVKVWFGEHFRASPTGEPGSLSDEELAALRSEATDPRTKALVWILSETGIRAGEVIRLDKDDVRFDPETTSTVDTDDTDVAATVEIDREKRGEIVTDRRPLSETAAAAVEEYLQVIDEYADADAVASPGLFVTPFKTSITSEGLPSRIEPDGVDESGEEYTWRPTGDTINQWLKDLAAATDHPEVTPDRMHSHLFRHTLGTMLGEQGYSGDQIGAFLGRASAADEYVHLDESGVVVDMAQAAP